MTSGLDYGGLNDYEYEKKSKARRLRTVINIRNGHVYILAKSDRTTLSPNCPR